MKRFNIPIILVMALSLASCATSKSSYCDLSEEEYEQLQLGLDKFSGGKLSKCPQVMDGYYNIEFDRTTLEVKKQLPWILSST